MQYSTTRAKNLPSVANESIIGKGKIRFPGVHSKYAEVRLVALSYMLNSQNFKTKTISI